MSKTKKLLAALGILFFNIFGLIAFFVLLIRSKKRKYESVCIIVSSDKEGLDFFLFSF